MISEGASMNFRIFLATFSIIIFSPPIVSLKTKAAPVHRVVGVVHQAASEGNLVTLKELISNGKEIDIGDSRGFTPLHWAAAKGHVKAGKILISAGARINATTKLKATPLYYAVEGGHLPFVELLLSRNANVDSAIFNGSSALFVAAENGNVAVTKLLIENGADVNKINKSKQSPLLMAAFFGQTDVGKILLSNGANPNLVDKSRRTPLHAVAAEGFHEFVEILIFNGANRKLKNDGGFTAFDIAVRHKHNKTAELLKGISIDWNSNSIEGKLKVIQILSSPLLVTIDTGSTKIPIKILSDTKILPESHVKSGRWIMKLGSVYRLEGRFKKLRSLKNDFSVPHIVEGVNNEAFFETRKIRYLNE
jgi:ankyrin repeat protein